MKIIVTGGAGFIGSHIVGKLLERGDEVLVIDDFSSGQEENLKDYKTNPNLKVVRKSICDDICEYFDEVEVVFHLAALPQVQFSIENPIKTHEVNVNGMLNVLECARKAKVKRFVFSSSSAIYGDQDVLPLTESMIPNPMSPYATHKLIGEHYCNLYSKIYGLECISLRYFNVFGPKQNPNGNYACLIPKFIKLIESGETPIINGDGKQTRDFVYIDDVVSANLAAANIDNKEAFGETFNVGSGEQKSVNEITNILIGFSGSKVVPKHGPSVIEPKNTKADIEKIEKYLRWKPQVEFEKGIKTTHDYFK